jgi:hypothetical protein
VQIPPPQSIQSSVRKTTKKWKALRSIFHLENRKQETEMRDLYNRKERLAHCTFKAKTELDEPDITHVLQFVESIILLKSIYLFL